MILEYYIHILKSKMSLNGEILITNAFDNIFSDFGGAYYFFFPNFVGVSYTCIQLIHTHKWYTYASYSPEIYLLFVQVEQRLPEV